MTTPRWARALLLAVPLAAAPVASGAQTVITFQPAACATGGSSTIGDAYHEAGFGLTATPRLVTWCQDSPNYAGAGAWIGADVIGLVPGPAPAIDVAAKLFRDSGPLGFTPLSIDLANLVGGALPAQSITIVGAVVGGGYVTQTFDLAAQTAAAPSFRTFRFDASFANVETLFFQAPGFQGYQLTNVTIDDGGAGGVNVAPEPGTVALTASGGALLALVLRRRGRRYRFWG